MKGPPLKLKQGSYAPLVTPLRPDGQLDESGLRRLIDHVIGGGCAGVLLLGSSGENAAVGRAVRRAALAVAADAGAGELLVGVAQCGIAESVEEIVAAEAAGATAVVVTPPFYGPVEPSAVERFYATVAERSPLPVLAYNIPSFTGVQVPVAVIRRLAESGALVGVKDSGRDLEYLQQVIDAVDELGDIAVFTGTDSLILPAMQFGASGAISIAANVAPAWTSALCAAVAAGELAEAKRLQRRLSRLAFALRTGPFPAGAKHAVALLGLCDPTMAAPARPLGDEERRELARFLAGEELI